MKDPYYNWLDQKAKDRHVTAAPRLNPRQRNRATWSCLNCGAVNDRNLAECGLCGTESP